MSKANGLPRCVYHHHGAYWLVKGGKWTRLGEDLTEALARHAELISTATATAAPPDQGVDLIAEWLKVHSRNLAPSTLEQYETAIVHVRDYFKAIGLGGWDQVESHHIARFKVSMADKPNMGNRCLSVLRQVFAWGLEQGHLKSNPAIGIRRHAETKRGRLIGLDEYHAIYAKAGDRLQVIMDLCVRTGQRIGDVLTIRREQVREDGLAFVQKKTGAKLVVPWTPELRAVVDRAKGLRGAMFTQFLLVGRGLGRGRGKAPDYRSVADQWRRACEAAGVTDAHLHDLRAMAATAARRQGLNATALLGHTSAAMTARYLRDKEETLAPGPSFGTVAKIG